MYRKGKELECCGKGQIVIATKLYPSEMENSPFYRQELKIDYFEGGARKVTFRVPICLISNILPEEEFAKLFIDNVKKEFPLLEPHADEIVNYMKEKRKWLEG